MASLEGSHGSHIDQPPPERNVPLPLVAHEKLAITEVTRGQAPGHTPHAEKDISKARRQASFIPTAQELHDNPEAPRVTNIMSGPRYPIGQVLAWMGCMVWNYDILLDPNHDIAQHQIKNDITTQAEDSHVTTSGPACGTYTSARQIRKPDLPGGSPPELRSQAHPLGVPQILARPKDDRDRVAVEQANVITTWLLDILTRFVQKKKGVIAGNPRNSLMWETPEAKERQAVQDVEFTNYDACAYAGTRHKKQSLLHNIPQCRTLSAVCHHTHSAEEWKPIRGEARHKVPHCGGS